MSKPSALIEPFGTGGNSVSAFDVDKVRADFPKMWPECSLV